ncbi:NADH-quinone oxidoreductase subunit NuoG [Marinobacter sp. NP-4(2019)]|uniref:NADH-quinone oxidoreductase subunit NuoG n=1 Tax=Marinobacter sp. NP-4(2019) TaxID=2488665 RepID=UPI000FC3E791|nr:NADH-quinone oxidoreductase subunit NuoG [Marinobacter sp. NP-4(2019)]AZT82187.1 NADH-quinone oxidoreductase subunit NuoG [Marinobacter sp. NP-4(2019)]
MATIHVDGQSYEVNGADNLLQACLSLGLDIPYFCWHPAMGSVGACRQCAVRQYKDREDDKGMLVMSCMTPAADGTRIDIEDEEARAFRASVVEWLMINHPHDCPVCEEGGHCHLQDMTVMTGHDRRRYRFRKRTRRNQYLGPFIAHEMNRCITCYRCVRFYNDYAGGTDLGAFGAKDNIYFGRHQEGTLESRFAGNLTEVCPTGVFTDQSHSDHYTRKWDLQFAPGICHQCAVGCNISPGERYGDIRRIENRYHGEVNGFFLCDLGRFGYGYVNRQDRPRVPEFRPARERDQEPEALEVDTALARITEALRHAGRVIGIGSPRASLESNHQLRELVGEANFSTGINANEQVCLGLMDKLGRSCGLPAPTLREVEGHDAVLLLGEDPMESAARLGLAIRQAIKAPPDEYAAKLGIPHWNAEAMKTLAQDHRQPLFIAYPAETELDSLACNRVALAPADIARLGFAVAHAIDPAAPDVPDLDEVLKSRVSEIAGALLAAERPLVVSGGALDSPAIIRAAGNIARALARRARRGGLLFVRREVNSTGLSLLGGQPLEWALDQLAGGSADAAVILENDLYQRLPETRVDAALANAQTLVVLDHQRTRTLNRASFSLPAASFAEGDGTLVSLEGRAQRFFQVYEPSYFRPETRIHESWRWLHGLSAKLHGDTPGDITLDQVTAACSQACPDLAMITAAAPGAGFRIEGLRLAREPHRYSGRTSMRANQSVSEPRVPQDPDTALAFSMEGYSGFRYPHQQVPFAWAPGWNSPQAWNKFTDEVGGHLRGGDPGIRLLDPRPGHYNYECDIPAAFRPSDKECRALVLPCLFGGEETSARAEPIRQRMESPVLLLSDAEATALGVEPGGLVTVTAEKACVTLPARVPVDWPQGLVGLPAGTVPVGIGGGPVTLTVGPGSTPTPGEEVRP